MSRGDSEKLVPVQAAPVLVPRDHNGRTTVAEGLSQLQGLRVFRDVPLSEVNPATLQHLFCDPAGLAKWRSDDGN